MYQKAEPEINPHNFPYLESTQKTLYLFQIASRTALTVEVFEPLLKNPCARARE